MTVVWLNRIESSLEPLGCLATFVETSLCGWDDNGVLQVNTMFKPVPNTKRDHTEATSQITQPVSVSE